MKKRRNAARWNLPLIKAFRYALFYHRSSNHLLYVSIATLRWEKVLFHYKYLYHYNWCIKLVLMKHRNEENESRLEIMFIAFQRNYYGAKKYHVKTKCKEVSFQLK